MLIILSIFLIHENLFYKDKYDTIANKKRGVTNEKHK